MNRVFGEKVFSSVAIEDSQAGYGGIELWSLRNGVSGKVASVIFWDAMGHWYVETFGDVPLEVLQQCIVEAKAVFPTS